MQILNLDSEPKDPSSKKIPSIVHAPTLSQPSKEVPQHLFGNEDLAWERFMMAVTLVFTISSRQVNFFFFFFAYMYLVFVNNANICTCLVLTKF